MEAGDYRPGAWAEALAAHLADEPIVVLPASPDGRDLAPRLSAQLQRQLYAMSIAVSPSRIDLVRRSGTELHSIEPPASFVATLQPGVRGADHIDAAATVAPLTLDLSGDLSGHDDPTIERVLPADAATIDLSEAPRIVAGGAGLDDSRTVRATRGPGNSTASQRRRDPRRHRPRLGRSRATDRHDRGDGRPAVLHRLRDQRGRAAHQRARASAITSSASTPTRTVR